MSVPGVTVVIPCYNHGRFVADAVRSCLAQHSAEIHVVIVNDGSNDGTTPEACDRCADLSPARVAVVHQSNKGLSAARNVGAAEARRRSGEWAAEYLVFLDADDWIEPTFVTRLHEALLQAGAESQVAVRQRHLAPVVNTVVEMIAAARQDAAPDVSSSAHASATAVLEAPAGARSVAGGADEPDDDPELALPDSRPALAPGLASHAYCQERLVELHQMIWAVPDWDPRLMLVTNLHPVTTLIRRECFEAVGGFDESLTEGYEDWDLWLKFVERGWRGVRVREPLFIWRRHSHTTMIVEAGKRHERLFGHLVTNHLRLYLRHGPELLVLSNRLLRQSDANWLDESGEAIVVRDTRNLVQSLAIERDAARTELQSLISARQREEEEHRRKEREIQDQLAAVQGSATVRVDAYSAELAEARRLIAMYERKPVVRASRAMHALLDRLPRPIGGVIRRAGRAAASVLGRS